MISVFPLYPEHPYADRISHSRCVEYHFSVYILGLVLSSAPVNEEGDCRIKIAGHHVKQLFLVCVSSLLPRDIGQ